MNVGYREYIVSNYEVLSMINEYNQWNSITYDVIFCAFCKAPRMRRLNVFAWRFRFFCCAHDSLPDDGLVSIMCSHELDSSSELDEDEWLDAA